VVDLLAGTLDAVSVSIGAIQPQLMSGHARAIVIASPNRSALGPDVQTTKEGGFALMNGGVRYFLGAPAATPRPIIDRLSKELDLVLQEPAIAAALSKAGFDIVRSTPEQAQAMIQEQFDMWGPLVKELKISFE
jgi:tripartite-type tricarboxylate transporter receptor subunit TctC